MDSSIALQVWGLIPPAYQHYVGLFLLASYALSHFISKTDTPPPNTPWGKVYAVLELVAGLYGKAKQEGIPVVTADDILKKLSEAMAKGEPITPEKLSTILSGVQKNA